MTLGGFSVYLAWSVCGALIVAAELIPPQFSNPIYSSIGYTGSRVLETNYTASKYVDFTWTQTTVVDSTSTVWLADTKRHAIIKIPQSTTYVNSTSMGSLFAGIPSRAGYYDGSLTKSLFNATQGIAILEQSGANPKLIIADTGNHCIRMIDTKSGLVSTLAGMAGVPGLRDGDGRKALFNLPTSIGVEKVSGLVVVQDNSGLLRLISVDRNNVATVSTLVDGACRGIDESVEYSTIVTRTVRCQINWVAGSEGSTQAASTWSWPTICMGNDFTCNSEL